MKRRLVLWSRAISFVLATAAAAESASVDEIAKCRETIVGVSSRHATRLVTLVASCHAARNKGKLPAATDCNDVNAAATALGKPLEPSLFDGDLGQSGEDCDGVTPWEAGYTSCPSPCASILVTDYPSVDACMRCVTESHVEAFASSTLGQATLPLEPAAGNCAKALLRVVAKVPATILKVTERCLDEWVRPNTCLGLPFDSRAKIARARSRASARVSKSCASANFGALGTCATSSSDAGCILAQSEIVASLLGYDASRMLGQTLPDSPQPFVSVTAAENAFCALEATGRPVCLGYGAAAPSGRFIQLLAAGAICGLRPDGSVDCWDYDSDYFAAPAGEFVKIAGTHYTVCGIRTDGTLACWGSPPTPGAVDPPPGQFTDVATGYDHSCAVGTDGTVACWGENDDGESTPPPGTFVQVAVSEDFSCGIRSDQTIECWGDPMSGGTSPPSGTFTHISTGHGPACGVRTDQTIDCWNNGFISTDSYPDGTFVSVSTHRLGACALRTDGFMVCFGAFEEVVVPDPNDSYTQIAANQQSCGLHPDGTVSCWHDDYYGAASPPVGTFTQISAGHYATCGVRTDQTLECWGSGLAATPPAGSFQRVSLGRDHGCALKPDSTVECWGNSFEGATDAPSGAFTDVSCGGQYTCGVRPDSSVECWGWDYTGQASPPNLPVSSLSAGSDYACGISPTATALCWGSNEGGQAVPPFASGPYLKVSTNPDRYDYRDHYSCGLRTDGTLDCWPFGSVLPPPGVYSDVSVGSRHACGIRNGGRAVCWGLEYLY